MFKEDDILVSLETTEHGRKLGDILKVTRAGSTRIYYRYGIKNLESDTNYFKTLRLATSNEILAYKKGIRNINNIKNLDYEIY